MGDGLSTNHLLLVCLLSTIQLGNSGSLAVPRVQPRSVPRELAFAAVLSLVCEVLLPFKVSVRPETMHTLLVLHLVTVFCQPVPNTKLVPLSTLLKPLQILLVPAPILINYGWVEFKWPKQCRMALPVLGVGMCLIFHRTQDTQTLPMDLAAHVRVGNWTEGVGATLTYRINVMNRMLQREALAFAQTSGFTTIIVVQWADLMICKTRWLSIRQQGMSNPLMNFGLLFETILGAAVCFVPFLNVALQTRPLRLTHWFPGMPFMVLIFMYDEIRKYLMRSGGLGIEASKDITHPITGQV